MPRFRPNGGIIGPTINQSTGSPGVFTVPGQQQFNTRYQIEIFLWGGGGGGGTVGGWTYGAPAGGGGGTTAILNAVPGTIYNFLIGGAGQLNPSTGAAGGGGYMLNVDNRYGGGGGGYTGMFTSAGVAFANALLLAGGGGGGGSSRAGTGNAGGAGGGTTGQQGFSPYDGKTAYGGGGGTQGAGGTATGGGSGSQLQGGNPGTNSYGGGGGGGYYGGAGGGYSESNTMAGGGGGSGYALTASFLSSSLYQGSGQTPGNSAEALRGTYGNGGNTAAAGVQGVAILRYFGSQRGTGGTVTTSGGYTIHTLTSAGTYTC